MIPGGESPLELYKFISDKKYPLDNFNLVLTDERLVSPDDQKSNFKNLSFYFANSNSENVPHDIFPNMKGYLTGGEKKLLNNLNEEFKTFPKIDLCILGVGGDGHTASIFPHLNPLSSVDKPFFLTQKEGEDFYRLSASEKYILMSEEIIILLLGNHKKKILHKILSNEVNLPICRIINSAKNRVNCVTDINL